MKWFFLTVIVLPAFAGNAVIFEQITLARLISALTFNVFFIGIFLYWRFSYFSNGLVKERGLILGASLMVLAIGIRISFLGISAVLSDSCGNFISRSESLGLWDRLATYIQSLGYCQELGFCSAVLGLLFAYPSIRLFVGMVKQSGIAK